MAVHAERRCIPSTHRHPGNRGHAAWLPCGHECPLGTTARRSGFRNVSGQHSLGDTDANSMTDMTLSDGTEVSIDGKLIADATAAGKRVALDQAISGAEAAGAACRALVVYGPGPVATGGDAPSYPVPILSRIDVDHRSGWHGLARASSRTPEATLLKRGVEASADTRHVGQNREAQYGCPGIDTSDGHPGGWLRDSVVDAGSLGPASVIR